MERGNPRRGFLAGASSVLFASLAGCSSVEGLPTGDSWTPKRPTEKALSAIENVATPEPLTTNSGLTLTEPYPWWEKHLITSNSEADQIRWEWLKNHPNLYIHPVLEDVKFENQFITILSILLPREQKIYSLNHHLRGETLVGEYEIREVGEQFYTEPNFPIHNLLVIFDKDPIETPRQYEVEFTFGSDFTQAK